MFRLPVISCIALLAIAACSNRTPFDDQARANAALPDVDAPAPSAIGEPHENTVPAHGASLPTTSMPMSLQGRWALAPADCSSRAGAAKSLLIVTPDQLRFYDSSAVPASDVDLDDTSIEGNFAFTGEGRSWTKYEALKFANHRLTRTEINPTASFSYAKCS